MLEQNHTTDLNQESILYIDNAPQCLIAGKSSDLVPLGQESEKRGFHELFDLINRKCITRRYFGKLQEDIEAALAIDNLSRCNSLLNDFKFFMEEAEECVYLRPLEINLRSFIERAIESYQGKLIENPDNHKPLHKVLKGFSKIMTYTGCILKTTRTHSK